LFRLIFIALQNVGVISATPCIMRWCGCTYCAVLTKYVNCLKEIFL